MLSNNSVACDAVSVAAVVLTLTTCNAATYRLVADPEDLAVNVMLG